MAIRKARRNGAAGFYLDSPLYPVFFPDTNEGNKALDRRIGIEIRVAKFALAVIYGSMAALLLAALA